SMEFIDDEYRPRFQIPSRPLPSSTSNLQYIPPTKLHIVTCFLFSFLLLFLSFRFFSESQTLTFFLVWFSLSFLVAPFT
ncbi:hypothetical protein, partial [Mycobacterium tuberculosis]|uniref:hypothetical protein n=1 Tax=Mycobacterium tuberculosis TaxID=1773 RepID=UPI00254EF38C